MERDAKYRDLINAEMLAVLSQQTEAGGGGEWGTDAGRRVSDVMVFSGFVLSPWL
jgi:hypothetical protein